MHVLTKIFVVLAAVLSVMLSALTVTYSVNAEQIRRAYDDAVLRLEAAEAALSVEAATHTSEKAGLTRELDASNLTIVDLRDDLATVEQDRDRLRREKVAAEEALAALRGQIDQFSVADQTKVALLESFRAEVSDLREREVRFRSDRLDLEDTISDQTSQLEVMDQRVRALQEQLAAAEEEIEQVRSGRVASAGEATPTAATVVVTGRVESVRTESATGQTFVNVNLGANDELRENNLLYVVRGGDQYIGTMVLVEVDNQQSVARVTLTDGNQQIRVGDAVISRLRRQ